MKTSRRPLLLRVLKITGITLGSLLLALFLAPILFPGTVAEKIKQWTNNSIAGELNFSRARLSFFKHFPSLTLTLYDFSLKGSAPFSKDTLVAAEELALGVNLQSLVFEKSVKIDKIFVSNASIDVQVNEKGEANYNVYISDKKKKPAAGSDSSGAALNLEKIVVDNCLLRYNDRSIPLSFRAAGLHYNGWGDLSRSIFDLHTHARIDSLDFAFNNESYLLHKKIDADLITRINTNSLAFFFEKNNLLINKLPVEFNGKLDFLPKGYDLDFNVSSQGSDLHDVLTALPPQYLDWLEKTRVSGLTDILLTLKGRYEAASNSMPDMEYHMKIRDGSVAYDKAPEPLQHLKLDFTTRLPRLNTDSLEVRADSLSFTLGRDQSHLRFRILGLHNPFVEASIQARLDLGQLDQALGLPGISLRGNYRLDLEARGRYASGPNPASLRHNDTVLLSIPAFTLTSALSNGYLKYDSLPQALQQLSFQLNSSCPDNDYSHTRISLEQLQARAMNSSLQGNCSLSSLGSLQLKSKLQGKIQLGDLKSFLPLQVADLGGLLTLDLSSEGKLDRKARSFPQTSAKLDWTDGRIQTRYYPHPISAIRLHANITDPNGSLKGLAVEIQPAAFEFEGKPFTLQGSFRNFEDLAYQLSAKGEIDLGRVYQVFARKGISVEGSIKADLSLQGTQHDALSGNYSRLHNQGTLQVKDLSAAFESYPQPFLIKTGLFRFSDNKMWFRRFDARYGQSDFSMDGWLQNALEYALTGKGTLKGDFKLHSRLINADEFMAFSPSRDSSAGTRAQPIAQKSPAETGVIIIPDNLELHIEALADQVSYNGLPIEKAGGTMELKQGVLQLSRTGFTLIGCQVQMDARYQSLSPRKASFDYSIKASDFDIHKAYQQIKLFHDLASAAGKAQGIVSLDYKLKGVLDASMHPIYPSLEGGGVLSIKNVKIRGLKLLGAVSKKTGKDSLANPDLSKVDLKTTIKNNLITLERVKMKMAGFRPRIEGQTSFDGRLNLKMRLGLPPLGIIGIPMRITGTQEHPIVRLGRGDKEELPETEYQDNQQP